LKKHQEMRRPFKCRTWEGGRRQKIKDTTETGGLNRGNKNTVQVSDRKKEKRELADHAQLGVVSREKKGGKSLIHKGRKCLNKRAVCEKRGL